MCYKGQNKLRGSSGMITYTAELRTEYLTNTIPGHHRCANLLCAHITKCYSSYIRLGNGGKRNKRNWVTVAGTFGAQFLNNK